MKKSCRTTLYTIVLTSSVAFLSGCHTMPTVPPIPEGKKQVDFDLSLLQDCKNLPKAKSGTDLDLKDWASGVTSAYNDCATRKKKLDKEVKKAFNLEE